MAANAGAISFTGRDGELRIYDANNNYVKIRFEQMDMSLPLAKPRPIDNTVPTVGGYVLAPTDPSHDEVLYGPSPAEFSFLINHQDFNEKIRPALCNPDLNSPWKVGSTTWTSTKGRGSIIMPDGTYYATQPFSDVLKVAVKFETTWKSPINGSVFGVLLDEAYTPPQNLTIQETPDAVTVKVNALIYGNIRSITAFTAGTPS